MPLASVPPMARPEARRDTGCVGLAHDSSLAEQQQGSPGGGGGGRGRVGHSGQPFTPRWLASARSKAHPGCPPAGGRDLPSDLCH